MTTSSKMMVTRQPIRTGVVLTAGGTVEGPVAMEKEGEEGVNS